MSRRSSRGSGCVMCEVEGVGRKQTWRFRVQVLVLFGIMQYACRAVP